HPDSMGQSLDVGAGLGDAVFELEYWVYAELYGKPPGDYDPFLLADIRQQLYGTACRYGGHTVVNEEL
ncbi:MAG: hypothetical protein QF535_17220, partial [Anaerolineales bacterium]|nr:hypothetical protein [Anaerolineales bacterium]